MSKPIFTWYPDLGAQQSMKPSVHQTKFGDGYESRVAQGINTMPAKWTVHFTRNIDEISQIKAFLEARAGLEAFTWTDTLNNTGTYVCRDWTVNQKVFGVFEIAGTFEQVFEF